MAQYRRKKKLVNPQLQLKLVLFFMTCAGVAVFVQAILLTRTLSGLAQELPSDGQMVQDMIPAMLGSNLFLTFLLLLPTMFVLGVLATFRIAGPLYRFEQHLKALAAGEHPGPCRLREGDELQDVCDLINAAVVRLRSDADASAAEPDRDADELRAA